MSVEDKRGGLLGSGGGDASVFQASSLLNGEGEYEHMKRRLNTEFSPRTLNVEWS